MTLTKEEEDMIKKYEAELEAARAKGIKVLEKPFYMIKCKCIIPNCSNEFYTTNNDSNTFFCDEHSKQTQDKEHIQFMKNIRRRTW